MSGRVVTISISCYNYARFLGDAIDSALNQDYEHIQVIVVDDGSTDGSVEVASAYGDRILLLAQGVLPPDLLAKAVKDEFVPAELKR